MGWFWLGSWLLNLNLSMGLANCSKTALSPMAKIAPGVGGKLRVYVGDRFDSWVSIGSCVPSMTKSGVILTIPPVSFPKLRVME